jgi:DNA-binding XRE family transcriptional regulator
MEGFPAMPEPHERLEEAMKQRRLDLRMNWRELASAAGISYEALRSIRRGDYRPSDITARDLDDALKWKRGGVLGLLDNTGEPEPLDVGESEPSVAELADRLGRMEQTIARQQEENENLRKMLREITGKDSGSVDQHADEPGSKAI